MVTAGQPTLYKPEYCGLAHNYCLLGATNAELAAFFEVTRRSIDNWIARHPDFAEAVRSGRVVADARVARCLYDRAVGWQHAVKRTVMHRGEARTLKDVVRYPPDTQALHFLASQSPSGDVAGACCQVRRRLNRLDGRARRRRRTRPTGTPKGSQRHWVALQTSGNQHAAAALAH
jgi:hypothetical protein